MKAGLTLCPHFEGRPDLELPASWILDHWDGPVLTVARCRACDALALLDLVDWSASGRLRIFRAAALEPAPFELLLRDLARGSCDLGRAGREVEALVACAGPAEHLVAIDLDAGRVLASGRRPPGLAWPRGPLQERLPDPDDDTWFRALGLAKASPLSGPG